MNDVKSFWDSRAQDAALDDVEVTHRDIWQRWLEINTIERYLGADDRVLDIGCGSGHATKIFARHVKDVVGVDFSADMIERAQAETPENVTSVIKPGGRYIFVEGVANGRVALNAMRQSAGLEAMPDVWHNQDFHEPQTTKFIEKYFVVSEKRHFGVYDLISRVINPGLVAPEAPEYDSKLNEIGARLALDRQDFEDISRVMFLVLERRP